MGIFKKLIDFVMDILETIVFVGSLFIVVYLFLFQPHMVKGASMDDSFHDGDYILTSKIAYRFSTPMRGDVVVFKSPYNPDIDFIKRIIGLPGDRIKIENGAVYVNGNPLDEPYAKQPITTIAQGFIHEGEEVIVPKGYIFAMGDNRPRSDDSREFGFIAQSEIIGKVFFQYFPPSHFGPIKNPYSVRALRTLYFVNDFA